MANPNDVAPYMRRRFQNQPAAPDDQSYVRGCDWGLGSLPGGWWFQGVFGIYGVARWGGLLQQRSELTLRRNGMGAGNDAAAAAAGVGGVSG
eukprot:3282061-Rhodomonas_salina.1